MNTQKDLDNENFFDYDTYLKQQTGENPTSDQPDTSSVSSVSAAHVAETKRENAPESDDGILQNGFSEPEEIPDNASDADGGTLAEDSTGEEDVVTNVSHEELEQTCVPESAGLDDDSEKSVLEDENAVSVPSDDSSTENQMENREKRRSREHRASLKTALDSALDADVSEPEDDTEALKSFPKSRRTRTRTLYFTLGIVVSILSVIGLISSIHFAYDVIYGVVDNSAQKEEFAAYIYPVIIADPPAVDTATQLSSDTVLTAAIWDIILYADKDKYTQEYGNITVPQVDVENHAARLFGSGLRFEHKTLGDIVLPFYYNEETASYMIPVSPQFFPYSPRVEEISRDGDVYILRVGYISPSPAWMVRNDAEEQEADKYMTHTLKKNSNGTYTILSIREAAGGISHGGL